MIITRTMKLDEGGNFVIDWEVPPISHFESDEERKRFQETADIFSKKFKEIRDRECDNV